MPHAEQESNTSTMSQPMTNGEKPHSKVLSHITSYPVVSDSITFYKSQPLGQKSISLASTAYSKFAFPLLPYLQGPYSYFAPYVERADSIADSSLTKVDSTFPIVKEDTSKIKGTVLDYAFFPLKLADQGKQYLFGTFHDEYSKTGGSDGIVKLAKATISTELKFGHDALNLLLGYWTKGKEAAQKKGQEVKN
ncbi:putative pathogenesis associated protein Cap20 [Lepidopterella palustris CBS 459.81]|uniref:Putative pathogenesis associated protein Cap20 n=1 Tax=Lepidopterella palustris CBS 459.81 TaxID=1314670 RepID=A0A8E2E6I1_9PEZI|nr:putative pathogenesis associated protein Cap20 [Lepidopterella palustris CBS 459.81]